MYKAYIHAIECSYLIDDSACNCFEDQETQICTSEDVVVFSVCVIYFFSLLEALEEAVEALSSGSAFELPLIRPQLTLLQDYSQPLERYDDYEDDEGELRAESNLAEKFGEFASNH